tara:strand:- start:206405 stop:206665 length:261 start_codon:yes stop_codon:yes gene_type:complete
MKRSKEERLQAREELMHKVERGDLKVSEAVKLIRALYDMNQTEFGEKVGLTKKTIYQIENDTGNPSMESINKALSPMKLSLRVARK